MKKIEGLEGEKNILFEEMKTLKNEINNVNKKCNEFKNDKEELIKMNTKLNDEISKLKEKENNINNKLNDEIFKLKEDKNNINIINTKLNNGILKLKKEKENKDKKISLNNKIINIDKYNKKYSVPHKYLLIDLIQSGYIFTEKVANIMLEVNRSDFFQSNNPYANYAQSIGYGATISAPNMHAIALESLADYCTGGGNILDIGSVTGFLTVCLSKLTNGTGKVIGVEHIPEIYNMGTNNVKKSFKFNK